MSKPTLQNLRLNPDERAAIIGQTGTGKSVLATQLLLASKCKRIAIIDPKGMFDFGDIEVVSNPARIIRGKLDRFIFRPKAENLRDLSGYDAVYKYCYDKGDFFVYTDDIIGIMSRTQYPHYLQVCYQMGRAKRVAMLSAFQRPAWVPLFLCSESSKFFLFHLTVKTDIQRVQQFVSDYSASRLHDKFTFLFDDIYSEQESKAMKINLERS
jgi:ABC-type dipeptide/oligopeptide/nickel transport system ATPase component